MEDVGYHWTDFYEIWHMKIKKNLWRKFMFDENLTRILGPYLNTYEQFW